VLQHPARNKCQSRPEPHQPPTRSLTPKIHTRPPRPLPPQPTRLPPPAGSSPAETAAVTPHRPVAPSPDADAHPQGPGRRSPPSGLGSRTSWGVGACQLQPVAEGSGSRWTSGPRIWRRGARRVPAWWGLALPPEGGRLLFLVELRAGATAMSISTSSPGSGGVDVVGFLGGRGWVRGGLLWVWCFAILGD
jgi:hypothetical protein